MDKSLLSIAQILGHDGEMPKPRYQEPTLKQNKNGSWFIRAWIDVLTADGLKRRQKTLVLGPASMKKRDAITAKNRLMATVNRSDYVIQSQMPFREILEHYVKNHVRREDVLASSTRAKYLTHIKNHIEPAFGNLMIAEVTTRRIDEWLAQKSEAGLSWATRMDLRNILSGIFTKARDWGFWRELNPAEGAEVGRKRAVRERRKLTDEQTRQVLASLRPDVRLIIEVALFCTLRISEILGLAWKHLDTERGILQIRQRYHRGDLDRPKNDRSIRDVPLGHLVDSFRQMKRGTDEEFVFNIHTRRGICRDDRGLNQHFLRPAAKVAGCYYKGFGFHAFRREAVTEISAIAGVGQALKLAGHGSMDTSLLYTLLDEKRADEAVRKFQERIIGATKGPIQ
jgi:integrase